jgi:hypothetical protein
MALPGKAGDDVDPRVRGEAAGDDVRVRAEATGAEQAAAASTAHAATAHAGAKRERRSICRLP